MRGIGRVDAAGSTFTQERDLNFEGVVFQTEIDEDGAVVPDIFEGTFEGGGHVITNLTINAVKDGAGLFEHNNGWIVNAALEGTITIRGQNNVGAITGTNGGTVSGCTVQGDDDGPVSITGDDNVGGIAGVNVSGAVIENCLVAGTPDPADGSYKGLRIEAKGENAGGIAGLNNGTITGCTVRNNTSTIEGLDFVGGIAGVNDEDGLINGVSVTHVRLATSGFYAGRYAGDNRNGEDDSVTGVDDMDDGTFFITGGVWDAANDLRYAVDAAEGLIAAIKEQPGIGSAIGNYHPDMAIEILSVMDDANGMLASPPRAVPFVPEDAKRVIEEAIERMNGAAEAFMEKTELPGSPYMIYGIDVVPMDINIDINDIIIIPLNPVMHDDGNDGLMPYDDRSVRDGTVEIDVSAVAEKLTGKARVKVTVGENLHVSGTAADNVYAFIMPPADVTVFIDIEDATEAEALLEEAINAAEGVISGYATGIHVGEYHIGSGISVLIDGFNSAVDEAKAWLAKTDASFDEIKGAAARLVSATEIFTQEAEYFNDDIIRGITLLLESPLIPPEAISVTVSVPIVDDGGIPFNDRALRGAPVEITVGEIMLHPHEAVMITVTDGENGVYFDTDTNSFTMPGTNVAVVVAITEIDFVFEDTLFGIDEPDYGGEGPEENAEQNENPGDDGGEPDEGNEPGHETVDGDGDSTNGNDIINDDGINETEEQAQAEANAEGTVDGAAGIFDGMTMISIFGPPVFLLCRPERKKRRRVQ
jgi:hypothetical protein